MTTQLCFNQSEAIELHGPHGLYLKPIAKLNISVTLPQMKMEGKSISNWEVMEKLKRMAKPDSFLVLRVSKSSLEFLRFEAEVEAKSLIKVLILRLDGKVIKLSGFPEPLKVRAAEAKISFPNRHDWDSFFRDAKNMNENNPGERPDTIKIESLPCKWFSSTAEPDKPSELIIKKIFELFGEIRNVDIPMLDPYRHESQVIGGNFRTFSSFNTLTFEAFIQYTEYIGFVKAMDALKGMKLMKKETITDENEKEGKAYTADIKVDFDKTRHLCAKSIQKREKERQRLIQLEKQREEQKRLEREEEERKQEEERRRKEQEELYRIQRKQAKLTRKEERRQQREEKRRQLREEKKRQRQEQELQRRIALEERKLLIALRQLESIRLLTELFERVKVIKQHEEVQRRLEELEQERLRQLEEERLKKEQEERAQEKAAARQQRELRRRELRLKRKLTKNLRNRTEQEEEKRRERLRQRLSGRARLKSAVVPGLYPRPHIDEDRHQYGERVDGERSTKRPKLKSAMAHKHR
ncbi:A-kinase anchor protein 17A-like [Acanthaster planci]|uniref:A-kinase anchor protein 17A-like n=1 Tax=Acanthaster planci TaxID=133434 RepID=A0A8B7XY96_ACAPL|nr:A-kinase anchor protein 17A-like [Acanthaster planci]XP_022084751.1 A-kinase anchor protein 17A-like [Acanthaster planci]